LISLISPAPFATTVTIPPPAVASTVSSQARPEPSASLPALADLLKQLVHVHAHR